jgi:hypothetical protein
MLCDWCLGCSNTNEDFKLFIYVNMRDFAFVTQPDGSVVRHVFIRTEEANQIMENDTMTNPELDKYRDKQHKSSIDTLTNQLKQLEADVKLAHTALDNKTNEHDITKDVLRLKLEDALGTLHVDEEPVRMSPTMLSAEDLSDLGIDSYKDEPFRKMSHKEQSVYDQHEDT